MTIIHTSGYCPMNDTTDAAPGLQAVFNQAAALGVNTVVLDQGDYLLNSPVTVGQSNLRVYCEGARLLMNHASEPALIFDAVQDTHLDGALLIEGKAKKTGGAAIVMRNASYRSSIEGVTVKYGWNGLEVVSSTQCWASDLCYDRMAGTFGTKFHGVDAARSYGFTLEYQQANNPPPSGVYGTVKTWAAGLAFAVNDLCIVSWGILQCTDPGNTGATAPTTPPGTDGPTMYTAEIVDGGVKWKFIGGIMEWIVMDSFGYSLRVAKCQSLSGWTGLAMRDTLATGTSKPTFLHTWNLECDHNMSRGVDLLGGATAHFTDAWLGSSSAGVGVNVGSGFGGEYIFQGCRIAGNWLHGLELNGGSGSVANCDIGNNGQAANNTYDGVTIGANVSKVRVHSNTIGSLPGLGTEKQRYGVKVAAGTSDYISIKGNTCIGNVTGKVLNSGTGANNHAEGNI